MREVESESESKMRPLIADRSNQQETQRFVSTWPHIWSNNVEIFFNHQNAPLCACPSRPLLILLFAAIVLAIATIFGAGFGLIPRGFAGFNVENNSFNNECELEKSGLINKEYGSLCHNTNDLTMRPNDTVFYFGPNGAGLCECNLYGYVFDVVLNENEFYCGVNNIFNNEINTEGELENGGLICVIDYFPKNQVFLILGFVILILLDVYLVVFYVNMNFIIM